MGDIVRNYPELTKNFGVREWKFLTDLSDLIDPCTDCPVLHPSRCTIEKSKCKRFRYELVTDLAEKYGYLQED